MPKQYMNETEKIRERIHHYLHGFIVDVGCANSKVMPDAYGIDGREFDDVDFVTDNLYTLDEQLHGKIQLADVVFSSHVLEHLGDHYGAVKCWTNLLKHGGLLILYLPDGRHYDNKENLEHMVDTRYEDFMFWFKRVWCGEGKNFRGQNFKAIYEVVESGMDLGDDKYSFYLVAKKI